MEKRFSNDELTELLAELKKKHGPIKKYLAKDKGIELMNLDAQISEQIIKRCTDLNIPVLTIHDSFIVQEFHENSLREFMDEALVEATKAFLGDTHKQLTELTVTKQEDKEVYKSPRYNQRLEKFQAWKREKEERITYRKTRRRYTIHNTRHLT